MQMSGREAQAVAACTEAYYGLSRREKEQVTLIEMRFLELPNEEYLVLAEVHCEHHGVKTSFAAGGAVPFKLDSSLEKTCLSAENVRLNMQDFIREETWLDKILRWLTST